VSASFASDTTVTIEYAALRKDGVVESDCPLSEGARAALARIREAGCPACPAATEEMAPPAKVTPVPGKVPTKVTTVPGKVPSKVVPKVGKKVKRPGKITPRITKQPGKNIPPKVKRPKTTAAPASAPAIVSPAETGKVAGCEKECLYGCAACTCCVYYEIVTVVTREIRTVYVSELESDRVRHARFDDCEGGCGKAKYRLAGQERREESRYVSIRETTEVTVRRIENPALRDLGGA
jgi:hypothetical protein